MRFIRNVFPGGALSVIRNAAFVLMLMVCTSLAAQASAQPEGEAAEQGEDDGDRSTAFRAVSGPELERVPGGQLLVWAYGLAWLAIAAFMWRRIGRLQSAASKDLARLSRLVESRLVAEQPAKSKK